MPALEELLRLFRGNLLPLGLCGKAGLGHAENVGEFLLAEVLLAAQRVDPVDLLAVPDIGRGSRFKRARI